MKISKKELMNILFWTVALILLFLGVLGYLEKIFGLQFSTTLRWTLLTIFILAWIGGKIVDRIKEKQAAESFYGREVIEIFPYSPDISSKMRFFTDNSGNKCVALTLKNTPIPNSVRLFEGGYEAPPITLGFKDNEVLFKNSGYSSWEEYSNKKGSMYQIRYFPKE